MTPSLSETIALLGFRVLPVSRSIAMILLRSSLVKRLQSTKFFSTISSLYGVANPWSCETRVVAGIVTWSWNSFMASSRLKRLGQYVERLSKISLVHSILCFPLRSLYSCVLPRALRVSARQILIVWESDTIRPSTTTRNSEDVLPYLLMA